MAELIPTKLGLSTFLALASITTYCNTMHTRVIWPIKVANPMTLSDLQGHLPIASVFRWDFMCSSPQDLNWFSVSYCDGWASCVIIIIIIKPRLTRHMSVTKKTNRNQIVISDQQYKCTDLLSHWYPVLVLLQVEGLAASSPRRIPIPSDLQASSNCFVV